MSPFSASSSTLRRLGAMSLRLRGGLNSPLQGSEGPPPFVPRSMWLPDEQEETAEAVEEAWEERQRQLEEDMPGAFAGMTVGQARERLEIALELEKDRKKREEALHCQLVQHVQRLKEAHAQITGGTYPNPPESIAGSPYRMRHRSVAPSASPAPTLATPADTISRAHADEAAPHAPDNHKSAPSKASADWTIEGTEEHVLMHRQQIAKTVLESSSACSVQRAPHAGGAPKSSGARPAGTKKRVTLDELQSQAHRARHDAVQGAAAAHTTDKERRRAASAADEPGAALEVENCFTSCQQLLTCFTSC